MGNNAGTLAAMEIAVAGLIGLSMLVNQITVENVVLAYIIVYFVIQLLSYPLTANRMLSETKQLAWEYVTRTREQHQQIANPLPPTPHPSPGASASSWRTHCCTST
jgi:hypothetical protein